MNQHRAFLQRIGAAMSLVTPEYSLLNSKLRRGDIYGILRERSASGANCAGGSSGRHADRVRHPRLGFQAKRIPVRANKTPQLNSTEAFRDPMKGDTI
jgi:hypothetical protein